MRALQVALIVLALGTFGLTACGSSEGEAPASTTQAAPTAITSADLDKDGSFWLTLTPDLKDELIGIGKGRLGEQRPDGATGIQAVDTSKLVSEVDKQYANQAKRASSIYETYTKANDTFAKAGLDDALDGLNQLCNSEPRPEQCGE